MQFFYPISTASASRCIGNYWVSGLKHRRCPWTTMRGTTDYDFYCRILSACSFIASKCQSLGKKEFHWSQKVLIGMLWIAMTFTHCILEEIPSIRSGGLNCKSCHPSEDGRTTKRFGVSCYDLQFWCNIWAAFVTLHFTIPSWFKCQSSGQEDLKASKDHKMNHNRIDHA